MEKARFNPEMLVLAREQRGHTQSHLAKELSTVPSLISKFERGDVVPTNENLERIAEFLDCPVEFFFQTDRIYGLGCSFLFHRRRKTMPQPEQRRLIAKLNVLRMQIERLLHGMEMDADNSFFRMDVDQHGGPEKIASLVRTAWNLPQGPVSSVVGAIESAGGLVVAYPFGNSKASGMSWWLPNSLPLFFINSEMPGDHQRFTLMHEVGHVIMHRIPHERIEDEANRFAAEFLMPSREIVHDLGALNLERAAGLKAYWKVSMQAIIRRAIDLKKIPKSRFDRLSAQIGAAGYMRNEPLRIDPEQPTLLRQLVNLHLEQSTHTTNTLQKLALIRNSREFNELYGSGRSHQIRIAQ